MFKKFIIIFLLILISTFFVGSLVWAQNVGGGTQDLGGGNKPDTSKLDNPVGAGTFPEIVGQVIKAFLGIIGTISLVMFVYGGITILTAAGRGPQITKGRNTLIWASLGIMIVFASYAILKFVFSAFGL